MKTIWTLFEQACSEHAQRAATLEAGLERSYAELEQRVRALAGALVARGMLPGERLAILEFNSADYLAAYFAAAGLGLVLQPLNHRLAARELEVVLEDAGARLLLHGMQFQLLASQLAMGERLALGTLELGEACSSAWDSGTLDPHLGSARAQDVAQLYYTSGTTGQPKGVMLTHANVCAHAELVIAELKLCASDRWGHFAPLFHLADAWATFAITQVGGLHVIQRRFQAEAALELIQSARISLSNLVPTMLSSMAASPAAGGFDPSSLRMILSGGAPITPALVRRIIAMFRCEYVQTYGMTETSPYLTMSLLHDHLRELPEVEQLHFRARTGRAFRGVELEVVGEDDRPVPADDRSVGEIRVRGATVSPGYWRQREETAQSFRGGWLYTGDLAVIDAEGYVNIVDRKKDMILSGGENVYSTEVENVLAEHPGVLECAVYGRADATWGEAVCAAVVLCPGVELSAQQLLAYCRPLLAGYKLPKQLVFLAELPKTGSGKISKAELRAQAK